MDSKPYPSAMADNGVDIPQTSPETKPAGAEGVLGSDSGEAPQHIMADQGESNDDATTPAVPEEPVYQVIVKSPNGVSIPIMVTAHETVQSIKQIVAETPETIEYSCFSLAYNGKRLSEFLELGEIEGLSSGKVVELSVVEDRYNEREVRVHVARLLDLLAGPSATVPEYAGVDAGISLLGRIKAPEERDTDSEIDNDSAGSQRGKANKGDKVHRKKDGAQLGAEGPRKEEGEGENDGGLLSGPPTLKGEHAFTNFDPDKASSLSVLDARAEQGEGQGRASFPRCVKQLVLSGWNPVPRYRQLRGDLLYLVVTVLEGETYHITASKDGFFVNNSSLTRFDPTIKVVVAPGGGGGKKAPGKSHSTAGGYHAHSLITLLGRLSKQFKSHFAKLQEWMQTRDPLEIVPFSSNFYAAVPWVVPAASFGSGVTVAPSTNASNHIAPSSSGRSCGYDLSRTQHAYLRHGPYGSDTLRDWNDELQSLRELPRSKLSERVARDRQIHRWQAEFTEAAVLGAMAVVEGELAPLNPLDPPDQHMYLRENIFFSKGTDSRDMFASLGGGEAAHVVTGKDIEGVRIINRIDPEGIHTLGSVVVDYRGVRVVAQTVVPGIFSSKSEERIVYGSIDNGKTVKSSQEFHELIRDQLVKALHLAEHTVTDSEGTTHSLYTSIESKGIVGADQRRYLLDLYRLNPVDIEFLESVCLETKRGSDEHLSVYPHKMVFLRRELLDIYWDSQFRQAVQAYVAKNQLQQPEEAEETPNQEQQQQQQQEEDEGVEENRLEGEEISRKDQEDDAIGALTREGQKAQEQLDKLKFSLEFNPDAFTTLDVVTAASGDSSNDGEPVTSDLRCKNTRDASRFLRDTVIPAFVHDLRNYLISPIDGESLTRIMHRRGVNIRYLGLIAELLAAPPNGTAEQHSPAGPHIRALVVREMIVRAVKHILRDTFRHTVADLHSEVFAHIINCLLGARYNPDPAIALSSAARSIRKLSQLTPASLATDLREQVLRRYRFRLPDDFVAIFVESNELVLLREISKAVGVQLALRNYRFEKLNEDQLFESVVGGGPLPQQDQKLTKQQRRALREKAKEEASRATSLQAEDVVNFYPLVKEASHVSSFADEASEAGTIALSRGQRDLGLELLLESATMHEQTYGFLHPETGRCYASIAMLYYQANEIEQACMFMHKAIIICERTQGVDSSETVHYYLNLGLLEYARSNTKLALRLIRHAFDVWALIDAPGHPDKATPYINIGAILQAHRLFEPSLRYFKLAADLNLQNFGDSSVATATTCHALAKAFTLVGDLQSAVNAERLAYKAFSDLVGEEDQRTKDSKEWLHELTASAVQLAKLDKLSHTQKQLLLRQKAATQKPLATRATQYSTSGHKSGGSRGKVITGSKGHLPIDDLIDYIHGGSSASTAPSPLSSSKKAKFIKGRNGK